MKKKNIYRITNARAIPSLNFCLHVHYALWKLRFTFVAKVSRLRNKNAEFLPLQQRGQAHTVGQGSIRLARN